MGLRQQKRDRTQDAIVTAAYRLFEAHGYDETTVEEIAAASDISPRTFYRYFESKDMTLAITGFRSVDAALERIRPDASIAELARAMVEAVERPLAHEYTQVTGRLLAQHPALRNAIPVWRARWAARLADGLAAAAGRDQPSSSQRLRAEVAMTIVGAAVDERLRHRGTPELSRLVEDALRVLTADLRTAHELVR